MQLGLNAPRPGAIPLRFSTYVDYSKLPTPPLEFGHMNTVKEPWGMLANDKYGCCAWSGAEHMTMVWTSESGTPAPFNDAVTLRNYAATGFRPATGQGDDGTDMGLLAKYWQRTGILDANGKRHKVAAVVDLNPGDLREIWVAQYLFQAVALGYELPNSAMEQTQDGKPWTVVRGASIEGGHFVPSFSRFAGFNIGVSWGQAQLIAPEFIQTYNDQGFVALSEEMLVNAKSIDGFDDALLRDDLAELAKAA